MDCDICNMELVPEEIVHMEAPVMVTFKTPFFDAEPISREKLVIPGSYHDDSVCVLFDAHFPMYEKNALLADPKLRDVGSLAGIKANFPRYDGSPTPEIAAWCRKHGERMAELPALQWTCAWDYVTEYEAAFAFAFGKNRGMNMLRVIEAISTRGMPEFGKHYRAIMQLGRSLSCYPIAPESDWVASWIVLQETMGDLKMELCNKGNAPWMTALSEVLKHHPYIDFRCALYWVSLWRRQNLIIRQAVNAGIF